MTSDPIYLIKVSDLKQVIRQEVAEAVAEALANQAQPAPVGALTAVQAAKFIGCEKTRFYELLHEYPELDAIGVTLKTRKDGKRIRRWPLDGLKAWLERNPQVFDEAA
jgi:hypothetical protein